MQGMLVPRLLAIPTVPQSGELPQAKVAGHVTLRSTSTRFCHRHRLSSCEAYYCPVSANLEPTYSGYGGSW